MNKEKKFFAGMAAFVLVLGASLFFIGCETEVEVPGAAALMHIDTTVYSAAELTTALSADPEAREVIEVLIGANATLTADTIPAAKTVIFRSQTSAGYTVTPMTTDGLTVAGTVYMGKGTTLVAGSTTPVIVTTGIVNVGYAGGGVLSADAAASVNNGATEPATVLGNTGKVSVNGGTLTYSGDGTLSAEAVGNWLGFVSKGELVVTAGLTASEVTPKAIIDAVTPKIAGKTVTLTATKAGIETETSLVIPAGLILTADGSDDLQYVTSVRAEAGGSFTAAAGTGKSTGLAVTANGYLELGDVSKLLASSVGEGGTLVLGDGSVLDDDVAITVAAFGSVNGTVFPGATSITAIGDGEFTIGSLTVPAGAVFTVACELTVTGTLAIEGDGSVGLALAADKVILPVGGALDVKHATGSFGEATQSDTKVTVVASGNPTATPAAGTKNGTMWTVTTASSGDGTDFSSTPIILGTLKYATNNSSAAVDGTACADADTAAAAGKLVAGTGTTITFAGDGE